MERHTHVFLQAVLRRKTGSSNKESAWAKARHARALMTKRMFELGKEFEDGLTSWKEMRDEDLLPMYLDGIVFTDQSHTRAIVAGGTGQNGSMGKHQWRVSVCPHTGALTKDGVFPDRRFQIQPKYDNYAQGCYSVCLPTINGEKRPMFLETFDYTGKKMTSVKDGILYWDKEMERVRAATGNQWNAYSSNNPYLERYGTPAEKGPMGDDYILKNSTDPMEIYEVMQHHWYLKLRHAMKHVSIRDFVVHLIVKSTDVFRRTNRKDTFMIWHDRLSILWDSATQAWLKTLKCGIQGWPQRSWADRFLRLRGKYNDGISRYYRNSLPGDSAELMPLDNHLFSDVKEGVSKNVAFSFWLAEDDPDKYSLQTPRLAYKAIQKAIIAGCPHPERIIEDIEQIPETVDWIIEAKGTYIADANLLRKGIRAITEGEARRNTVDAAVMEKFLSGIDLMVKGGGVLFNHTPLVELESVLIEETEDGVGIHDGGNMENH